ncbi:MAG: N-acetyltransferase [Clostridiales bacterium]|nr:N-acetyltransferase [Clostridiales bacterium]
MEFFYGIDRIYAQDEQGNTLAEIILSPIDDNTVDINHTFVDPSMKGQGLAGRLVLTAAQSLRRCGKKAVVSCSYTRNWFQKHPEFSDILR